MKRKKIILALLSLVFLALLGIAIYTGHEVFVKEAEYAQADKEYSQLLEVANASASEDMGALEIDFNALREINPDIVAWVRIEGTDIDYPVVQGANNDTYLKKTFEGNNNSSGTIFLDALNAPDFTDANSILYGHHMRNGSMFASLSKYKSQSYYNEHPTIMLYTPTATYRCEIFAAYTVKATSEVYTLTFSTTANYQEYLNKAISNSLISGSAVDAENAKQILTLSTCDYDFSNGRMVVQAVMMKGG